MAREIIDIIISQRGGRQVAGDVRDIGSAADATQSSVSLLRTALRGLASVLSAREVLSAIDTYQRMQNQLRVVGYETDQLTAAQQNLFSIAQQTRTPLEETVNLYGKLAQSAGELGKSQEDMMQFTQLTGQALAIQGTSTSGARAALLQLSQAMGEGTVRAQEYNSLIENARPLLVAAANGMDRAGGSVAKLRTLVLAGEVSSRDFFDAVLAGGSILEEQFGATVPTIGQALTVLNNAWVQFIGESQTGQTILSVVSGTLIYIAENFESIATWAVAAGAAFVTYWGAGAMSTAAASIIGAARAQIALNLALGATGPLSATAAAGIKAVQIGIRAMTAAIAANPLGALLVGAIALTTYIYSMRDAMVSFGGTTASVGSIIAVVWDRVVGFVNTAIDGYRILGTAAVTVFNDMSTAVVTFGSNVANSLNDFLGNWGLSLSTVSGWVRDGINTWIGLHVGMVSSVGTIVTQGIPAAFNLAMGLAKNIVLDAMQFIVDKVAFAIGTIAQTIGNLPGFDDDLGIDTYLAISNTGLSDLKSNVGELRDEFSAAGAIISGEFGDALATDYVGSAADSLAGFRDGLANTIAEILTAAAARDEALANAPTPAEFEFEEITPPGGAASKQELSDVQKAYNDILEETRGTLSGLVTDQRALDLAVASGIVNQDQYNVRAQDLRVSLAEWAYEGRNVAAATREANEAILQLKINAGDGTFADGFLLGLSRMTEGAQNFTAQSGQLFSDYFSELSDGIANSIGQAIVYSEDLGEALSSVAQEALAGLISAFVKLGIQWLVNAAIGKTLAASATAATSAQAAAAAAAWAPAAALASLATAGANAAPASAAIASTSALSAGVAATAGAFADGGEIQGQGGPREDNLIARVSNGEFVVNARDAQKNLGLLNAINKGKALPMFRDGGEIAINGNAVRRGRSAQQVAARDIDATTRNRSNNGPVSEQAPERDNQFVFLQDPALVGQYMQTDDGRSAIVKVLSEEGVI